VWKLNEHQTISPKQAFISIGSNIEPEKHLPLAIYRLHEIGRLLKSSNVYQNPPIGRPEQDDFLNAAVLLETTLPALEIRHRFRQIEFDLGRIRSEDKFAARTIDLDLCLLGDQVINSPEVTLPDPDLLQRAHLAVPLAELDPHFLHPLTGETLQGIADYLIPHAKLTLREDITKVIQEIIRSPSQKDAN
jgi:2-amino-4-hydroxy-6-hydroxymethyldihydropteridine diphosphokinase